MRLTTLALAAAIAAGSAAAREILFVEATPEEDAAIAEAFSSTLNDAEEMGAMLFIGAARFDLDGDGAPELLGMLTSAAVCGAAVGCPIGLFKGDDAGGWTLVDTIHADMVTVEGGSTRGWRDLALDTATGTVRMRWSGDRYAPR